MVFFHIKMILNKFRPEIIDHKRAHGRAPIIAVVGKRNSGKSVLINDLLRYTTIPRIIVMSGTEEATGFYTKNIVAKKGYLGTFVCNKFEESVIKEAIDHQKKCVSEGLGLHGIAILFDDLPYNTEMFETSAMRELFNKGLHYDITVIMSFQYIPECMKTIKSDIDILFVGEDISMGYSDRLQENFFNIVNDKKMFSMIYKNYAHNYGFVTIDRTLHNVTVREAVTYYRVDPSDYMVLV
jgi:hypothetical protein